MASDKEALTKAREWLHGSTDRVLAGERVPVVESLAALLRAEYERGVRDSADVAGRGCTCTDCRRYAGRILALLERGQ